MSSHIDVRSWAVGQHTDDHEADLVLSWLAGEAKGGCRLRLSDSRVIETIGLDIERLTRWEFPKLAARRLIEFSAACKLPHGEAACSVDLLVPGSNHPRAPANPCAEMTKYQRKPAAKRHLYLDPCAYCGAIATALDHIHPQALGGRDERTLNLTAACTSCNSSKHKTPLLLWLATRKAKA